MTRADRPPEWQIDCPWCNAAPRQRCTSRARGRRLTDTRSHPARITAHTANQTAEEDR